MTVRNCAILIFDEVEVLDFAGPFEVFSRTRLKAGAQSRRSVDSAPFKVFTIAAQARSVIATGGLEVVPQHTFADAPKIDIAVVPGGFGTRRLLDDKPLAHWLRDLSARGAQLASVCTGSLLLARAGLLRGQSATTHWAALDLLASLDPTIDVQRDTRFVGDPILTSAGVAAGIDMAFALVERFCGREVARETAHYIDYPLRDPAASS